MLPSLPLCDKFFRWLVEVDEGTSRRVAEAGCLWCGGRLHRGDYPRKPRGGVIADAGEVFTRRISLCCGREGCRRRSTPPSVRFLGRRVYLGVVVLLASAMAQVAARARALWRATGVPVRTVRRWRGWWQAEFPDSRLFEETRGRFLPPLVIAALPAALLERFESAGADATSALVHTLGFLAPLTTASVTDGARFVRLA